MLISDSFVNWKILVVAFGSIPGDGSFKHYRSHLVLAGDGVPIYDPTVINEGSAITTYNPNFAESDVGQYIHLTDGSIYLIEKLVNNKKVQVLFWGRIRSYRTSLKYTEIVFTETPTILPKIVFDRVTSPDGEKIFALNHIGTLLMLDIGHMLRITDVSEDGKTASVDLVGRVPERVDKDNSVGYFYSYRATAIYSNSLQFRMTLDSSFPAIQPSQVETAEPTLKTTEPVLKVQLKPADDTDDKNESSIYQRIKSIRLAKVMLQVSVKNMQEIQLRNDDSVFSPKTPFLPFGNTPKVGFGLYFSHPEISLKKLDSLALHVEWIDLPEESFQIHYNAYSKAEPDIPWLASILLT